MSKQTKQPETIIRSTKTSNKFANTNKKEELKTFIYEYTNVVKFFIDELWPLKDLQSLIPKDITNKASTWLSKRAIQAAAKQASGIVRGTKQKDKKRKYVLKQLREEGYFKKARKLQKVIEKHPISKPELKSVCPELDSRFVQISLENDTSYDGWLTLSSLGNKLKLVLPFKKTKHFNKMLSKGTIKTGIRLSKSGFTFMFDIPITPKKTSGSKIGLDIGATNLYTCSDRQVAKEDKHGHTLSSIMMKLKRKRKGSKGFQRAASHRENYINWSINQLNLDKVETLKIENIKYLRFKQNKGRYLSHFVYTNIFDKIGERCLASGVQIKRVNPTYTSQRCSECGWVRKSNRKGTQFRCTSCGFTAGADLNASFNIALDLPAIGRRERLLHKNRVGFYWHAISKESIVPCT